MWIDTHCHLDAAEFDADREAVVARARRAGVTQIVLPAVGVGNFDAVRELAHRHGLAYALGIHPMVVDGAADTDLEQLRAALVERRDDPRLVAVGEIGLDHFVPGLDRVRQLHFLVEQLKLAREFQLPVLLHVRRSVDAVLKQLRVFRLGGGIAHAFNGSEQQAAALVELGYKLGFGGNVTFDRALRIRHVAQAVGLDSIVLETDSPDIAPQWLYRRADERAAGATMRNEPAEVAGIAAVLGALRGLEPDAFAARMAANSRAALPRLAALLPAGR
jgi:TatD DNase family protein